MSAVVARTLVFAAEAQLRFRGGRIVVEAGGAGAPFQTDQPALVGWLAQFARPVDVDAALRALPDGARDLAARAVAYLQQAGALVDARAADAPPAQHAHGHAQARDLLPRLTQGVYELACDVLGFGPWAEQALAAQSGVPLHARLRALDAEVQALRAELQPLRAPYLARQLRALGVEATSRGLQLHVGCGPCHLPGWINLDIHPAPLATNVLWGLPFADGSVRRVFLSHLLEHLFYPDDVAPFLAELHRVLEPGGIIRIVVPDIAPCLHAYADGDARFFEGRAKYWGAGDGAPTRLESFLAYAGAGPDPARVFEAHKFGYDFETLARALERAGFTGIERSAWMESRDPALRVDSHSEIAGAHVDDRPYSLFVEAVRPAAEAP